MVVNFEFKYQELVEETIDGQCDCPPPLATPATEMVAFRFAFENCGEESFTPQAADDPDSFKDRPCETRCRYLSLSFYADAAEARDAHAFLRKKFVRFVERAGTYLAAGTLSPGDGVVLGPFEGTHFELFEAEGVTLPSKFVICEKLV